MVWCQPLRDRVAYPLGLDVPAVVRDQLFCELEQDSQSVSEAALQEAMITSQMSMEDIGRLPHSERLNRVM